jgi:mono/diheme cytochrome c family protein
MSRSMRIVFVIGTLVFAAVCAVTVRTAASPPAGVGPSSTAAQADRNPQSGPQTADGQAIFRFDTFGGEQLYTDVLRLHEVLPSVSPATALAVGLKVDSDALPPPVIAALRAGELDVNDPRVTRRLLELNAVVGVIGRVSGDKLKSVGITCALCHSTVDNSLAPGIGRRLDGWPNRDLNVGAILGLSPALDDVLKAEFSTWGPGRYDARHHIFDGTNLTPLHGVKSIPVVLPPAFGLRGVGFETYTGDGPISYWNSYVGVTQMGGHGTFNDPRIGVFVTQMPDLVTPKLPALLAYQLSLPAPPPPAGSFSQEAATRGQVLFNGVARCGTCHMPPTYTDVLSGPDPNVPFLHAPPEIGADVEFVARSATRMYRTTPLRGAWQHPPYFHDGRASDFLAVVNFYNSHFALDLTAAQKADLVEFLKSL